MSLNPTKTQIDVKWLHGEMMAILCKENVWICDTGANTHVMWRTKVQ